MAASKESLEKVEELEVKRHHDSGAKREWDKLIRLFERERFTQTPSHPKGPALKALIGELAEYLDEREEKGRNDCVDCGGCNDRDTGLYGSDSLLEGIDLDNLAERVFERLIFEVRIERERVGRSV